MGASDWMGKMKKPKRTKDLEELIANLREERARILQDMHKITDAINKAEDELAIIPLKRFYFTNYIESAEGCHSKYVEAETLEEAKEKLAVDSCSAILDEEDVTIELEAIKYWEDDEK